MAEIRPCTIADIYNAPEREALEDAYRAECTVPGLEGGHTVWPMYFNLEEQGLIFPVAAWDGAHMIGYVVVLIATLPHYGLRVASTETLFLAPEQRAAGAGIALLDAAEVIAKREGAVGLFTTAPVGSRLQRLLELKKSWRNTNAVFFKAFNHE